MSSRLSLPDVLVLDLQMPILNGIEVADQLLKERLTTRVVFLSALGTEEGQEICKCVGALGFVNKVDVFDDLIPSITAALNVQSSNHG
jgi:CheY-like chemotaxis protein